LTSRRLAVLSGDPAPEVRACLARAASFAQQTELAELSGALLEDTESEVRRAAAMSPLSFSPEDEAIAAFFHANPENEELKPLFLLAWRVRTRRTTWPPWRKSLSREPSRTTSGAGSHRSLPPRRYSSRSCRLSRLGI
jgi:hypothetical protein